MICAALLAISVCVPRVSVWVARFIVTAANRIMNGIISKINFQKTAVCRVAAAFGIGGDGYFIGISAQTFIGDFARALVGGECGKRKTRKQYKK